MTWSATDVRQRTRRNTTLGFVSPVGNPLFGVDVVGALSSAAAFYTVDGPHGRAAVHGKIFSIRNTDNAQNGQQKTKKKQK